MTDATHPPAAPSVEAVADAETALAPADAAGTEPAADEASIAELIAAFKSRTANYGLLSRLYQREVDADLLDTLHAARYRVSTGNADVDEGHRLIATFLSGIWENTLTELAADYMRVFFGHGYSGHAAAYPFESVYASEKRLLMQSARDEVLSLYRAAGLEKQESWKEGEDHIGLELEYMQILSDRTVAALCRADTHEALSLVKSQYNFLQDHLESWVPLLTAEMRTFAKTDFYRGLAHLTDGVLATDHELLEDLLAQD